MIYTDQIPGWNHIIFPHTLFSQPGWMLVVDTSLGYSFPELSWVGQQWSTTQTILINKCGDIMVVKMLYINRCADCMYIDKRHYSYCKLHKNKFVLNHNIVPVWCTLPNKKEK